MTRREHDEKARAGERPSFWAAVRSLADTDVPLVDVTPREVFAALLTGFVLLAITNAAAIELVAPWPHGGWKVRALQHAFDAGEAIGVGALAGALGAAFRRWVPGPPWVHLAAYTAVSTFAMSQTIAPDLERPAAVALNGRFALPVFAAMLLLVASTVPVAHLLGAAYARLGARRALPLGLALGVSIVNHVIFPDDSLMPLMPGRASYRRSGSRRRPRCRSNRARGRAPLGSARRAA